MSDPLSFSKLKLVDSPYLDAYKNGFLINLDEINLASKSVLQSIQESIGSNILSIETQGRILEKVQKNKNFCLIATQNPNIGSYKNKRQDLGVEFLSRFTKIYFDLDKEELKNIAIGIGKKYNYSNFDVISNLVDFHLNWIKQNTSEDDVQCFTIREIISTIKSLAKGYSIKDCLNAIYGARYRIEKKKELMDEIENYPYLIRYEKSKEISLNNFPFCYLNDQTSETLKQIMFSLENGRHIILTGDSQNGKTQIAKWCSEYYDKINNIATSREKSICFCTNYIKCSDLIGCQKPSPKIKEGKEMITWVDGFVTTAVKNGGCIVLDNINEAPSTFTERLNSLIEKKLEENKIEYFEIPENPKDPSIKINEKFRIICTCDYDKISKMSPAFINRFDVIVLEKQFEEDEYKLKKLIGILYSKQLIHNNYKKIIKNNNYYEIKEEDDNEEEEEDNDDDDDDDNEEDDDDDEENNQNSDSNPEEKEENEKGEEYEKIKNIKEKSIQPQNGKNNNQNKLLDSNKNKNGKYDFSQIKDINIKNIISNKLNNKEYYYDPIEEKKIYLNYSTILCDIINKIYNKLKYLTIRKTLSNISNISRYIRAIAILLDELENQEGEFIERIIDFLYILLFENTEKEIKIDKDIKNYYYKYIEIRRSTR